METTETGVAFRIGHTGHADPYPFAPYRITSLRLMQPVGEGAWAFEDLQHRMDGVEDDAVLPLETEMREGAMGQGARLLAIETNPSFSELPADAFADYLAEEGLSVIADARGDDSDAPGRERYSRRSKILLGGVAADANYAFGTPIGQTLEIVPVSNPTVAGPATFDILYRGLPAEGLTVALYNLDIATPRAPTRLTDAQGRIGFDLPPGRWMLSTAWASALPEGGSASELADWDTIFSTFTFTTEPDTP